MEAEARVGFHPALQPNFCPLSLAAEFDARDSLLAIIYLLFFLSPEQASVRAKHKGSQASSSAKHQ